VLETRNKPYTTTLYAMKEKSYNHQNSEHKRINDRIS